MELYKLKDQVQEAVDCNNSHERESLIVTKVTKPTLICSINESLPEKYFNTIDCEVATTTRRAMTIACSEKDIVINYRGERRKEVLDFIRNYVQEKSKSEDIRMALRDSQGNKCMVYAPIKNGIEIAIYSESFFNCNVPEITEEFNKQRYSAGVSIDDLVGKIEEEFKVTASTELPEQRNHIKNNRGILRSCNTGKNIFKVKKKIKRIRTPMIFDETQNANIPKTSLLGFGGLNNTNIINGFYEGDLTISYQEDELKETIKLLEDKGGVEWLDGRP